jgi:hypothetical protein
MPMWTKKYKLFKESTKVGLIKSFIIIFRWLQETMDGYSGWMEDENLREL